VQIGDLDPGRYSEQGLSVIVDRDNVIIQNRMDTDYLFSKVTEKGNSLVSYGITPKGQTVIRSASYPKTLYTTETLSSLVNRFREKRGGCPVCASVTESMTQLEKKDEEITTMPLAMYGWLTGAALVGEAVPIASEYLDEMVRQKMNTTPETLPLWARPSLWVGAGLGASGLLLGWKVFKSGTGYYASVTMAATAFATTLLKLIYDLKARSDAGVSLLFPEKVIGAGVSPAFRQKKEQLGQLKKEIAMAKQGFRGEPPATPWAEGIMERPFGVSAYDFEVAGKEVGRL
jgi:hypothetical protein